MPEPKDPVGRREQTKIHNRQMILTAARQVFAQLGLGAATVRDIIRATPLAPGTFYNYFKSKEEVHQALQDEMARAIRPRLRAGRATAETAEEFVSGSFGAFFEFVQNHRAEGEALRPGLSGLRMDAPEMIAGFEELRADLDAAIARGLFPAADSDYLAASFAGVAFEIAERMLRRETADAAGAASFATALFLGGVRALPPKP